MAEDPFLAEMKMRRGSLRATPTSPEARTTPPPSPSKAPAATGRSPPPPPADVNDDAARNLARFARREGRRQSGTNGAAGGGGNGDGDDAARNLARLARRQRKTFDEGVARLRDALRPVERGMLESALQKSNWEPRASLDDLLTLDAALADLSPEADAIRRELQVLVALVRAPASLFLLFFCGAATRAGRSATSARSARTRPSPGASAPSRSASAASRTASTASRPRSASSSAPSSARTGLTKRCNSDCGGNIIRGDDPFFFFPTTAF
jgi:hypothetical protein